MFFTLFLGSVNVSLSQVNPFSVWHHRCIDNTVCHYCHLSRAFEKTLGKEKLGGREKGKKAMLHLLFKKEIMLAIN
jgi:hypothetical protein